MGSHYLSADVWEVVDNTSHFGANVSAELQRFDCFGATQHQGQRCWAHNDRKPTIRVETADEDVVVTLSGTSYMVKYCKADSPAGLKLYHSRGDDSAPIHDIHFLARAWQLANAKAKELGWFAQTGHEKSPALGARTFLGTTVRIGAAATRQLLSTSNHECVVASGFSQGPVIRNPTNQEKSLVSEAFWRPRPAEKSTWLCSLMS
jgi:hypothetical protein